MEYQWISDRKISVNELHVLRRRKQVEIEIIDALLRGDQRIPISNFDVEHYVELGYTINVDGLYCFIIL